jgi:hypothetical protein
MSNLFLFDRHFAQPLAIDSDTKGRRGDYRTARPGTIRCIMRNLCELFTTPLTPNVVGSFRGHFIALISLVRGVQLS